MLVLLLVQMPPAVVQLSWVLEPGHVAGAPPIAAGAAFTVSDAVAKHPALCVYVITAIPVLMPVTTPVPASTVALETLLLDHVPPVAPAASVVVAPGHTCSVPVTGPGIGVTVTITDVLQPAGRL